MKRYLVSLLAGLVMVAGVVLPATSSSAFQNYIDLTLTSVSSATAVSNIGPAQECDVYTSVDATMLTHLSLPGYGTVQFTFAPQPYDTAFYIGCRDASDTTLGYSPTVSFPNPGSAPTPTPTPTPPPAPTPATTPAFTSGPTVTGNVAIDGSASCDGAAAVNSAPLTYEWMSGGSPLGITGQTWGPITQWNGISVYCRAIATDGVTTVTADSPYVMIGEGPAVPPLQSPYISGMPKVGKRVVGKRLVSELGRWSSAIQSFSVQWQVGTKKHGVVKWKAVAGKNGRGPNHKVLRKERRHYLRFILWVDPRDRLPSTVTSSPVRVP